MQKTHKAQKSSSKNENTVINFYLKTQVISLIITILLFIIVSVIALFADIPESYDLIAALFVIIASTFVTAYYSGLKIRSKGIIVGIIYTLPINSLIIITSLAVNNFEIGFNLLFCCLAGILSGAVGGIVAVNKRLK